MPLFDKREFAFAFKHDGVSVIAYTHRNVRTGKWEAEYCNIVTKDTVFLPFPPINASSSSEALKHLRQIHYAHPAKTGN